MTTIHASTAGQTSRLARRLLVATALMGAMGSLAANADSLTAEQRALVAKYKISKADQAKLFAPAQTQAVSHVEAMAEPTARPVRHARKASGPLAGTYVWLGGDTYKGLGERITNINGGTGALTGSFGGVLGVNSGLALGESDFGIQAGASAGIYDWKGRLALVPNATAVESQLYYTVGLYKRANISSASSFADGISLGLVYDGIHADNWGANGSSINLGQVRGTLGFAVTDQTEIGVWGAMGVVGDRAAVTIAGAPNTRSAIRAATQGNLYVKHQFEFGGEVTGYVGAFDGGINAWQVGLTGKAPLNDNWSAFGSANYVAPRSASGANGSGEEQFSASVGLAYYFGGNAASSSVTGDRNLPLQDVASNRTFIITDK